MQPYALITDRNSGNSVSDPSEMKKCVSLKKCGGSGGKVQVNNLDEAGCQ